MDELINISTPEELTDKLLATNDQQEINQIINMFNLNLKKKEAIRSATYADLQDKVTTEISERLNKRSAEFSNKELLDCLTAFDTISSKNKVDSIEVPKIAIQNNINVQGDALDAMSRQKIQKYIESVLSQTSEGNNG